MDISKVKKRLDSLNKPKQEKQKIDYAKVFWKPTVGKHTIRIVPSKENPKFPFTEVFFYYGISKFPLASLTNWGEEDPIVEFTNRLRQDNASENWDLIKKLTSRMRVFVPVIVRGEEEKGTRLWQIGKTLYDELLKYAADEDYADYDDIANGRDFTVEGYNSEVGGRTVVQVNIRPKGKTTPLSDKESEAKDWLENQPSVLDNVYKTDYDYLKKILANYLDVDEEEEETEGTQKLDLSKATDFEEDDAPVVKKTSRRSRVNSLFEKE